MLQELYSGCVICVAGSKSGAVFRVCDLCCRKHIRMSEMEFKHEFDDYSVIAEMPRHMALNLSINE